MRHTEQVLGTAIAELRCLNPDKNASLDELVSLNQAQKCIDELLRSCVTQLRAAPQSPHSWSEIAYALDSPSVSATRQRFAAALTKSKVVENSVVSERSAHVPESLVAFWLAFATQFSWDFLPTDFLHALYVRWMRREFPVEAVLSKTAFTGRLKKTLASESEAWVYTRVRPAELMSSPEPLEDLVPHWSINEIGKAQYGLLRNAALRRSPGQRNPTFITPEPAPATTHQEATR